jgi:3-hydroxy-3-methylglutaryl CoA synthase
VDHQRTGIRTRHIAAPHETTATLAFEAAARALALADLHPSQVELIIVATSTPEYMFPSTACLLQDYLGAGRAGAFDLSAACSGFAHALQMARNPSLPAQYAMPSSSARRRCRACLTERPWHVCSSATAQGRWC